MSSEERRHRSRRHRERAREPIWLRPPPGGRRRSLDRAAIASTALRIADEEGFEAVSMRRVAGELRVGTMSLYHYIDGRDDLLALMDDAIMSEVLVPEGELPADWRGALTAIAHRSRDAWRRHPWTLTELVGVRIGPNGMRHLDQSLGAVAGLGLSPAEQLDLITFVDDYVVGFVTREQQAAPGDDFDWEWLDEVAGYIHERLASGEHPHLQALVGEGDPIAAWRRIAGEIMADERFDRGLARLLDGVELELSRRAG